MATIKITLPLRVNITIEVKLEAKFETLAHPEAVTNSSPNRLEKAKIKKVPVPGPIKPS